MTRLQNDPIAERKKEWFVYLPASEPTVTRPNPTGMIFGPFRDGTGGRKFAERFAKKRGGKILGPFDPRKQPARRRAMMEERTKQTPEIVRHMVEELTERPSRTLTAWEEGFLADMADMTDRGRKLSERQFDVLERIYAEKTL